MQTFSFRNHIRRAGVISVVAMTIIWSIGIFNFPIPAYAAITATGAVKMTVSGQLAKASSTTSMIRFTLAQSVGETLTGVNYTLTGSNGFATSDLFTGAGQWLTLIRDVNGNGIREQGVDAVAGGLAGLPEGARPLAGTLTITDGVIPTTATTYFFVIKLAAGAVVNHEFTLGVAAKAISTSTNSPTISAVTTDGHPIRDDRT